MEKDIILERLQTDKGYKLLKKGQRLSVIICLVFLVVLVPLWLSLERLISFEGLVVSFFILILPLALKELIISLFIRRVPIQYDTSIVKEKRIEIHKIRVGEHGRKREIHEWEYLVTLNGKDLWAKDCSNLSKEGQQLDISKLQVGRSVIVFEDTTSNYYVVSNE